MSSESERGGGEEEEVEEVEPEPDPGLDSKPLDLHSSATSLGSSMASLPLPATKVIPGGGSEAPGLPFRKERRPESGDGEEEEEDEEEEATTTLLLLLLRRFVVVILFGGGPTQGAAGHLRFGAAARDVEASAGRIVIRSEQRSAPRSAIARRETLLFG